MKDKIADMLIPYMRDSERNAFAQAILELIAKELPKEKELYEVNDGDITIHDHIYNQCLKTIKHKLGVE
jgi:hypothetical protein